MFAGKPTAKKLLSAASKGETSKIRRSLKVGLRLDVTDENGRTPLHLACASGNESAVILVLGSGGNLFAKDNSGCTPLHLAAENGATDVIESLFETIAPATLNKILEDRDNEGKTALHYAVARSNMAATRILIIKGSDIDSVDNSGKSPLEFSTSEFKSQLQKILLEKEKNDVEENKQIMDVLSKGDLIKLKLIIQNGRSVNATNPDGQSLIHVATLSQLKDIVQFLIEQKADVNAKDSYQKTALHHCSVEGIADIAELLLVTGKCDPNPKDCFGCTPLHYAAEWNRTKVISLLLKNGAVMEEQNANGCTALHQACKFGKVKAVYTLLQNKANIVALDFKKCTPLHYATQWGRANVVYTLLEQGAPFDINLADETGRTPLHTSTDIKNDKIIKMLLDRSANSTAVDNQNRTALHSLLLWPKPRDISMKFGLEILPKKKVPIHTTAMQAHFSCGVLLIGNMLQKDPSSINSTDSQGRTPLHWAIINQHKELILHLITKAHADTTITDSEGNTPLFPLSQPRYPQDIIDEVTKVLNTTVERELQQDENISPSKIADLIQSNNVAELSGLINDARVKVETAISLQFENNQSVLHIAAMNGFVDMFLLLLPHAHSLLNQQDSDGRTALFLAAKKGQDKIVKELILAGADPSIEDKYGSSTLAVSSEKIETLIEETLQSMKEKKFFDLMEKKDVDAVLKMIDEADDALFNCVDEYQSTPLHVACVHGLVDVATKLLDVSPQDVDAMDENYQTPLHWASLNGFDNIIELLLENGADVNAVDIMEQTPLHWAIIKKHESTAVLLAKKGADLNAKDSKGKTAISLADEALQEQLQSFAAPPSEEPGKSLDEQLFEVLEKGGDIIEDVKTLIAKGASVHAKDQYSCSCLGVACIAGCVDVAQYLIEQGGNINDEDENYQTPLHWAALKGHVAVIKLLVEKGADINCTDQNGQTPLHWAVIKSHFEASKLLIELGADYSVKNFQNFTPINLAKGEIREFFNDLEKKKEQEIIASLQQQEDKKEETLRILSTPSIDSANNNGDSKNDNAEQLRDLIHDQVEGVVELTVSAVSNNDSGNGVLSDAEKLQKAEAIVDHIFNKLEEKAEIMIEASLSSILQQNNPPAPSPIVEEERSEW